MGYHRPFQLKMAPMKAMKAMKAIKAKTSMGKGALCEALASKLELKRGVVSKLFDGLAEVAAAEVKSSGVFTIPGVARIKTRSKPATKAGKKMIFGKEVVVKAKPAKTIVKAFPVATLKQTVA